MDDGALSLHFELREGGYADLETAGLAAIAFARAVKAAARAIDPNAVVQIKLVDADQGSLTWNTLVDWIERHVEPQLERIERGGQQIKRTRKIAIALAVFLVFTAGPIYLAYFGDGFTDQDRSDIQEMLEWVRENKAAEQARQDFYKALEQEPQITQVSVRESPQGPDIASVPSARFGEGSGLWTQREADAEPRTTYPVLNVVLVRPALSHSPRAWTFKAEGLPEFEATMRDPEILAAIASESGLPIRFREGVAMTIQMEVHEELVDGEWKLVRGGRSVTQVIDPKV